MVRRLARLVAVNGACRDACASGGRVTSDGSCQVPVATGAATLAMVSGLTLTLPWPMVAAASWATPLEVPTNPEKLASGNCHCWPKPNPAAALLRSAVVSRWDRPAKAVAQDWAKSPPSVAPWSVACGGTLRKLCPPTGLPGLQGIGVFMPTPLASSASVDTIVNAAPGGYCPAPRSIFRIPSPFRPPTASLHPLAAP